MARKRHRRAAKAPGNSRKGDSSLSFESDQPNHEELPRNLENLSQRKTLRLQNSPSRNFCYPCSLNVETISLDKPCPNISCEFGQFEVDAGNLQNYQETPGYVLEERLCHLCSRLDFEGIFIPKFQTGTDLPEPRQHRRAKCIINRDFSVVKKHNGCPFCRLLLSTIQLNDGIDFLKCVVLRGYVEEFSLT
jgi:hypothetical protein